MLNEGALQVTGTVLKQTRQAVSAASDTVTIIRVAAAPFRSGLARHAAGDAIQTGPREH